MERTRSLSESLKKRGRKEKKRGRIGRRKEKRKGKKEKRKRLNARKKEKNERKKESGKVAVAHAPVNDRAVAVEIGNLNSKTRCVCFTKHM